MIISQEKKAVIDTLNRNNRFDLNKQTALEDVIFQLKNNDVNSMTDHEITSVLNDLLDPEFPLTAEYVTNVFESRL